jgi:hypothetical protein
LQNLPIKIFDYIKIYPYKIKIVSLLFLLLFTLFSSYNCKKQKLPPRTGNYDKDMEIRLSLACQKIQECNIHLYRTFPGRDANTSTVQNCKEKARLNLENSKKFYNDQIRSLSLDCVEKIISADCQRFITELATTASCMQLPKEVSKIKVN